MGTPIVYVICDNNCKFEGMTKEQILTAIAQAVSTGEIKDVDAGFVQTIKTINGVPLKFFVGEQSAYDALTDEEKENLFAIITNDTTKEGLFNAIEELKEGLEDGTITPARLSDEWEEGEPFVITTGQTSFALPQENGLYAVRIAMLNKNESYEWVFLYSKYPKLFDNATSGLTNAISIGTNLFWVVYNPVSGNAILYGRDLTGEQQNRECTIKLATKKIM